MKPPRGVLRRRRSPSTSCGEPGGTLSRATELDATEEWVPQLWRDMDTTLAVAPLGEPTTALMLGRPGGPHFRPSEVARLGYLAGIVASILR